MTPREIIARAEELAGLSPGTLYQRDRRKEVVRARRVAAAGLAACGLRSPQIAHFLSLDDSTVRHHLRKIRNA